MKKACSILLAVLALFSGASCTIDEPGNEGCITLTLSSASLETKAGNGDVADGGGFAVNESGEPDVVVAIVDKNDNIVAWYPENYGNYGAATITYSSSCSTAHTASTPTTESTLLFTGPQKGTYTVYAVANTAGLSAVGSPALSSPTTGTELQALVLSVASGTPTFATAMPLSATGTLTVTGESNPAGQIDLSLKRVVARVSLIFKNLTGESLDLHACSITLKKMNPSRGYLFAPATDYVSGYDRDLVFNGDITELTDTKTLDPQLAFPSTAPQQNLGHRYLCDISFRIAKAGKTYNSGDPTTYESHSFEDLPVHDHRSADILALSRNQDLKIETTISKKSNDQKDISFNFVVAGWEKKEEYVIFH